MKNYLNKECIHTHTYPQMEPYMEQLTGSNSGKEYNNDAYCHTVHLIFMQSTS